MKLHYYDWLIVASILLFWTAHASTGFLIGSYTNQAADAAQAEAIVQVMEANPIARTAINLHQYTIILSLFITPAIILSTWVWFRRRLNNKEGKYGAESLAWIFFFVAATNALNDGSIALGVLLR